ncbi:MAG: hypothetical protein JNL35_13685 [Sphingopyxis sp.]|nr:hypothetical protein [Sphingopyxis sp.]
MVGQTQWVAIRAKAKAALGAKFDLRAFRDPHCRRARCRSGCSRG